MQKILMAAAVLIMGLVPIRVLAASDVGLYDPLPPPNSAFVRYLSAMPGKGSNRVDINGKPMEYLDYSEVSSYFVVPGGKMNTKVGDSATKDFAIDAGGFYTVIYDANAGLSMKKDPANDNQAKAQVILYNLSGKNNLGLKTGDGKVEIIPAQNAGASADRQINPVKVAMAVYDGERKVKDLGLVSLERARSYSAFVLGDQNVQWVRSATNTTR